MMPQTFALQDQNPEMTGAPNASIAILQKFSAKVRRS